MAGYLTGEGHDMTAETLFRESFQKSLLNGGWRLRRGGAAQLLEDAETIASLENWRRLLTGRTDPDFPMDDASKAREKATAAKEARAFARGLGMLFALVVGERGRSGAGFRDLAALLRSEREEGDDAEPGELFVSSLHRQPGPRKPPQKPATRA